MIEAARPATIARERLGEALGHIQELVDPPPAVARVSELIARAIGALYSVQSSRAEDPEHVAGVRQAMAYLSECLERLQDVDVRAAAIESATATVARTLSVLYPISKVQERGGLPSAPPPLEALPHDVRRSTQRMAIEADVGFQSDSNFYTGFTEDVSEGGLFVATYQLLDLGTETAVSFTLPDGHLVSAMCKVRWVRELNEMTPDMHPGMGLQFVSLSGEDKSAIEAFLSHRPAMFYDD
jgi:uncharacterized protein (TIGR02266 family)